MRQPGSALRTAATCSFSNAASASPLPFAARIFATTVSTSAIVVSSLGSDCVTQAESVPPPSCRMRVVRREPRKLQVVTDVPERAMVVFVHSATLNFQHRDSGMAVLPTTHAVYPLARDHLHFAEQITHEGLAPHKVRELWYWGAYEPNVIVDVTESIDRQIAALVRHESQMRGFNVATGETIGERLKKGAAALAEDYGFQYGAVFRRLVARR